MFDSVRMTGPLRARKSLMSAGTASASAKSTHWSTCRQTTKTATRKHPSPAGNAPTTPTHTALPQPAIGHTTHVNSATPKYALAYTTSGGTSPCAPCCGSRHNPCPCTQFQTTPLQLDCGRPGSTQAARTTTGSSPNSKFTYLSNLKGAGAFETGGAVCRAPSEVAHDGAASTHVAVTRGQRQHLVGRHKVDRRASKTGNYNASQGIGAVSDEKKG